MFGPAQVLYGNRAGDAWHSQTRRRVFFFFWACAAGRGRQDPARTCSSCCTELCSSIPDGTVCKPISTRLQIKIKFETRCSCELLFRDLQCTKTRKILYLSLSDSLTQQTPFMSNPPVTLTGLTARL